MHKREGASNAKKRIETFWGIVRNKSWRWVMCKRAILVTLAMLIVSMLTIVGSASAGIQP